MQQVSEADFRYPEPTESGLTMSEDLDQIAPALSNTLNTITNATKSTQGYGYKYAPLEQVLDLIRPAYAANKLALVQAPWTPAEGQMGIHTLVVHESGQWIASRFSIKIEVQKGMNLNQSCGALLTYLRRYTAMSFNFMAAQGEDVDGISKEEKAARKIEAETTTREDSKTDAHRQAIKTLTEVAPQGMDALTEAFDGLDPKIKKGLTKADKDALKLVAQNAP